MTTLLLCNRPLSAPAIQLACNANFQQYSELHSSAPQSAKANTPYLLNGHNDAQGKRIQSLLAPKHISKPVTELALTFGEDNTVAIAAMMEQLKDYNIALTGASTSVYGERISGFAKSVKEYQVALLTYREAKQSKAGYQAQLKQRAHHAFNRMQAQFRAELHMVTSHIRSRRGTPLTSAERGTNIAGSSRNVAKLQLSSEIDAHRLVRLSQHTKLLGNGLAVIDFGSRVGKVHNSYQTGGEWEKDLFRESLSFGLSAGTGVATAKIGAAVLGILVVATPIGWVGLVIGGLAIAGASAGAAMAVNEVTQSNADAWYEGIMGAISGVES
ncbi:hypothetical protein JF535_05880 [Microbulbifer salipaludis]|uniref:Uncharacterized protein n=1 Tax=Microbulbifer salipaludis TaxID=187980 RepID=A0ABS3E4Z6_9GAMM|nr:hypothetical protein [Microbulbifer salipaludis]MBN8430381.1 hypothetical protein [Microbulbifer salipaludis]